MRRMLALAVLAEALQRVRGRGTVVLESSSSLPSGWHRERPARGDEHVQVSIALKQPNLDSLRESMLARSRSGKHLSVSELHAYQQPRDESVKAVQHWLEANGVNDSTAADAWVSFSTTARAAKALFEADMSLYAFEQDEPVLRTQSYTIPASLRDHVDFVYPLVNFMAPTHARPHTQTATSQPTSRGAAVGDACAANLMTPPCLKQLYNWNYTAPASPSPARFAIAGFLDEFINYEDVANFTKRYTPELAALSPPYNFTVELINNGTNPQIPRWKAGSEAALDVQWAMALAYPTQITYLSTGGRGTKLNETGDPLPPRDSDNEPYLELLAHLSALSAPALPHVLSISYADDEQSVPAPYARRVCDLFLGLAARGVSILAASGDGGAAGIGRALCLANDARPAPAPPRRALLPTFPASCPWVTAVGATGHRPASAAAPYSSGGFSELFARPAWQDGAVRAYEEAAGAGPKAGLFRAGGRAIPDLAAVGTDFAVVWGGVDSVLAGTSASTPVVAAAVALADDARLRGGKGPVGWLNPVLYGGEERGLVDIVDGVSKGCKFARRGGEDDEVEGWAAAPGWDAVTGLGALSDLGRFVEALVQAP